MIVYRVELKCLASGRWFPIIGGTYSTRREAVCRAELIACRILPAPGIRVRRVSGGAQ